MPRASRHYIPGQIWHITHRCHKKEFLLRFGRDRRRWLWWLFDAKKRYGLSILNYSVTSNHIHLLVRDSGSRETIPNSLQLVAGRTGQEFNQRKNRKGAFWEDRYHATAIETDRHLLRCMLYIDLNMVRAKVVEHPSEWPFCGYNEIQNPKERYGLIDYRQLTHLTGFEEMRKLADAYRGWIEESLRTIGQARDEKWTESIAVGSRAFVTTTRERLGLTAKRHPIMQADGSCSLGEPAESYNGDFGHKNEGLSHENAFIWDISG